MRGNRLFDTLILRAVAVAATCLALVPPSSARDLGFRRGDANDDGVVDIADPVRTLFYLLVDGTEGLSCLDAADANDDSQVDISDATATLVHLFVDGPALPPPGATTCGPDLTADSIDCAVHASCPQAPPTVTTIEIESSFLSVALGDSASVIATAFDAQGDVIDTAPITFLSSSPTRLAVASDGTATGATVNGLALGIHAVIAVGGEVTSEPVMVHVFDPLDGEVDRIDGFVASMPGISGPIRVVSPAGGVLVEPGEAFTVERARRRNQVVLAIDDSTDTLLWMAIGAGTTDASAPAPITLDSRSTAEALLFLAPGILSAEPEVLETFRDVSQTNPGLEELATAIEALGPTWSTCRDLLAPVVDTALAVLFEGLPPLPESEAETLEAPGEARKGPTAAGFRPEVHPSFVSGIKVTATPSGKGRIADLKIENTFVRQVDVYLERVLRDGSRPSQARGPFQIGSATGVVPSIWKAIKGDRPLDPESVMIKNVDFDPKTGGSRQWRLFVYGFGLLDRLHPDLDRDKLYERWIPVALRSFLLDIAVNLVSVITTIDSAGIFNEDTVGAIVNWGRAYLVGNGIVQAIINAFAEGEPTSDLVDSLIDSLIDAFGDFLESDTFQNILAKVLRGSALTVAKEIFEKIVFVIELWSLVSSGSELVGFFYAIANAAGVEIIRIDDGPGRLEPPDSTLETAFTGCPYGVDLRMIGGEGPFTWEIESADDRPLPASLRLVVGDGPEFRSARLASDRYRETATRLFWVRVKAPLDPREPTEIFEVDSSLYWLPVKPPAPVITDVSFPNGAEADPGGNIAIRVQATHCADPATITGGNVTGGALSGAAALTVVGGGGNPVTLRGTLNVKKPQQDRPTDASVEEIVITVTAVGASTTTKGRIDVENVAPSEAKGSRHPSVEPGGVFAITIDAQDDNEEKTRVEVFAAKVKTKHPTGLRADPKLDELDYLRSSVDPTTGEMTFDAKKTVTVELPHPDNDGTNEAASDDEPFVAEVELSDDNGEPADTTEPVEIVVVNKAPAIDTLTTTPMVLPTLGTVAVRPLRVRIHVTDDNGHEDIGAVELNLQALGYAGPVILDDPVNTDADGRGATYEWSTDDVTVDCKSGCPVIAVATDADDEESNGGVSEPKTAVVLEKNLPPSVGADAILEEGGIAVFDPIGPTGSAAGERCPGDPMLFAVLASDPNGDQLAADLILDGRRVPLAPSPRTRNVWKAIIPAPAPGRHEYYFEIRELNVFVGAKTTRTPVQNFEVDDCAPSGEGPHCPDDLTEAEDCDGVDNDCDGEVDEEFGLGCPAASLHSGQYTATRVPICPGDPITYRVAMQGDGHPYPVRVEWQGPENGGLALVAQTADDGSYTGYYELAAMAPGTPGSYKITFRVQVPDLTHELSYPLLVIGCCLASSTPAAVGTGAHAVSSGDDGLLAWSTMGGEGGGGAGLGLFSAATCEETFHPIDAFQIDAPVAAGGWVAWTDWRQVVSSQAFAMHRQLRVEVSIGPREANQSEIALSPPFVVVNDNRDGYPNLWLHDLESPEEGMPLTANESEFFWRYTPTFGDGFAAWIEPESPLPVILDLTSPAAIPQPLEIVAPPPMSGLDASGRRLAWSSPAEPGTHLVLIADVDTGDVQTIAVESEIYPEPRIDGDSVVWWRSVEIFPEFRTEIIHFALESEERTVLSESTPGENFDPDVGAGFVTWIHGGTVWVRSSP